MTTKTKNSVRIQALVLTMAMLLSVFAILPVNAFAGAENTNTKSVFLYESVLLNKTIHYIFQIAK